MQPAPKMFKLKYKIAILVLLVSLPCVAAIGAFSFLTARHHVHDMIHFEYMGALERAKHLVGERIEQVEEDARFLARIPLAEKVMRGLSESRYDLSETTDEGSSRELRLRELEGTLREMAAARPNYLQISLLLAPAAEIVRIERDGNGAPRVSREKLHDYSSLPYFKEALRLAGKGEACAAPVSLGSEGRDGGSLSAGPILRIAAPVSSAEGKLLGMVTISVEAQEFFDIKKMFAVFEQRDAGNVFVADRTGFILHRCKNATEREGVDRRSADEGRNLIELYPDATPAILSGKEGMTFSGERQIFYSTLALSDHLSLAIGLDTPKGVVDAPVRQFRAVLFYVMSATLLMTWLLSALFSRHILRSVQVLHGATRRVARGDLSTKVEVTTNDEIAELAAGFNSMMDALQRKAERLSGLYELGIHSGKSSAGLADRIVTFLVKAAGRPMAAVVRVEKDRHCIVSFSIDGRIHHAGSFPLEGTPSAEVMRTGHACCRNECAAESFPDDELLRQHGIRQYAGVPVFSGGGQVMGVLSIMDRGAGEIPEEDIELLFTLSRLIAFEWERENYIGQIKEASLDTIHRLSRAAEYRDEDTGLHLQRMSHYAAAIARKLGLGERAREAILYAAPMHDVGKIAIPDRILLKPGKLDPSEWEIMQQHTVFGARILEGSDVGFIRLAEVIAITHHEKWDGSGYPKGLKGTEIPLVGRITAVADVFDALTSERPYKPPFALAKALSIIKEGRGSHFDPDVVDAFFSIQEEILAIKTRYRDEKQPA